MRGRLPSRPRRTAFAWLLLGLVPAGCTLFFPGLGQVSGLGGDGGGEVGPGNPDGAADAPADAARDARRPDAPGVEVREPTPVTGSAGLVGCADGSREGFPALTDWPNIAGCSGAWSVPGLLDETARSPQCGRAAGNTGMRPDGQGCSAADLCAAGWHVCLGSAEVARRSPSGCETVVIDTDAVRVLFVVAAGASPQGVCSPDPTAANDLHGCGTFGQTHMDFCRPLDRRMGFADCSATGGVWSCGGVAQYDREAELVTKSSSTLGGVLCCRDEPAPSPP